MIKKLFWLIGAAPFACPAQTAELRTPSGNVAGTTSGDVEIHDSSNPTLAIGQPNAVTGGSSTLKFHSGISGYANSFRLTYSKTASTDGLTFYDGGNLAGFTILNGGNVGINVINPNNKLQIGPNPGGFNGNDLVVSNTNGSIAISNGPSFGIFYGTSDLAIMPGYGQMALYASQTGKVGIGTTTPRQNFHVKGRFYLEGTEQYQSGWQKTHLHWRGHSLIMGSETGVYAHNMVELKPGGATDGPLHSYFEMFSSAGIDIHDSKVLLSSNGDSYMLGGNLGLGTTQPDAKLAVKGHIHTQEVRVDMTGAMVPDYVFADDYRVPSLIDVESYIKQNKHLPEIPSAKEIEANGLKLGEMEMLLLKKIEEMTLLLIDHSKKIEALEKSTKQ